MKAKTISILTAIIMVISMVTILPVMTVSAETYGDYEYTVIEDGTVEITKYNGSATTLDIPSEIDGKAVTQIGKYSFASNNTVKNISFPDSLENILEYAFETCPLKQIDFGNGLEYISVYAFSGCKLIESLTFPESLEVIGWSAFEDCYGLKSVTFGNKLKNIGWYAFAKCTGLTTVTFPDSVTVIGDGAFASCSNLSSIYVSENLISINEWAFSSCHKLKDIYYTGTKAQWNSISVGRSNQPISNAAVHYNYDPNHVHNFIGEITTPATCTNDGIMTYTCTCEESYTETIPKTGHNYQVTVVPATYDHAGYTQHACSNCGDCYKDNDKEMLVVPTVTDFKVVATSAQAVKLTCKKVAGATGYVFYREVSGKWTRVGVTKTNSYYEGKLKSGTTYRYAVKAYRTENGKNYYSAKFPSLWTSTNPAKVNFTLKSGSQKVAIKWTKVRGASGYIVYMKTSANGKWLKIKTTNDTSLIKSELIKGKTYWFTVKAYRTGGGKTYNGAFTAKSIKVN
ncbi:MAG: leucine-rich repeat protein [Ruminococcus sp.]|nr:leucine-rich repeat protein [Ruminococcus sp.]